MINGIVFHSHINMELRILQFIVQISRTINSKSHTKLDEWLDGPDMNASFVIQVQLESLKKMTQPN